MAKQKYKCEICGTVTKLSADNNLSCGFCGWHQNQAAQTLEVDGKTVFDYTLGVKGTTTAETEDAMDRLGSAMRKSMGAGK